MIKKTLNFKKCLKESINESLTDYNKCSDEVHSALTRIWNKYKNIIGVEDFVDIVNNWMLDEEDRHIEESCKSQIEYIHSEYDDDFGKRENYYDVDYNFEGLDDTAPKARKFDGEIEEVEYDDEF